LIEYLRQKPLALIDRMVEAGVNSPLTSSCGRLFDAVAAALGVCADRISYEGQAAIELEALANAADPDALEPYPFALEQYEMLEIDPAPMWRALLEDMRLERASAEIAARFHLTLAAMVRATVARIGRQTGISTVALSGGVFQNSLLLRRCVDDLERDGMIVLWHRRVPSNDGGISLGQAAVACARMQSRQAS
jgi:hydrogenase maturation protein HypF